MKKLYVGGLPYSTNDDELRELFAPHGEVVSASVVMDREDPTRSRGFGFVEMANDDEADKAIAALDGTEIESNGKVRAIIVNEARPREERPRGDRGDFRR